LHEISCPALQPAADNVYCSPLQQRSAGVENSRDPGALAIARVTITWVAAADDQRIAAAGCGDISRLRSNPQPIVQLRD
jgi:hypothetical protein